MALKFITAEEAASYVHHNDNVGFSGFTPAGCPKVVPGAIARKAAEEHAKGNPFQIGMFTGASTGDKLDGELARANAIKFRTPYQSNKDLRAALNAHQAQYFDLHLSELAQSLRYGFLGKIDVAIVEAADVTEDGEIVPTSGVGILPTICRMADRIIVELNCRHPKEIRGMHDIYEPADPPLRREIPIYTPSDRIGNDCVKVDPAKIVGVVRTDEPNEGGKFSPLDDVTMAIGKNVADFLVSEIKAGRLPKEFVPLQSGVGNVANAVLGGKIYIRGEAKRVYIDYYNSLQIKKAGADDYLSSVYSKLQIHVIRWAGVAHILGNSPTSIDITPEEMEYSVRCMDYFERCALKVYRMLLEGRGNRHEVKSMGKEEMIANVYHCTSPVSQRAVADALGITKQYVSKCLKKYPKLTGCRLTDSEISDTESDTDKN